MVADNIPSDVVRYYSAPSPQLSSPVGGAQACSNSCIALKWMLIAPFSVRKTNLGSGRVQTTNSPSTSLVSLIELPNDLWNGSWGESADEHPPASARSAPPRTVETVFGADLSEQALIAAGDPMLELGLVYTKPGGGLPQPLQAHTSSGSGVAAIRLNLSAHLGGVVVERAGLDINGFTVVIQFVFQDLKQPLVPGHAAVVVPIPRESDHWPPSPPEASGKPKSAIIAVLLDGAASVDIGSQETPLSCPSSARKLSAG